MLETLKNAVFVICEGVLYELLTDKSTFLLPFVGRVHCL